MCGICGIVHGGGAHPDQARRLAAMCEVMAHRGPDDAGHHLDGGVAIGSRRLAVLDPSNCGHMPMGTSDGRFWIAYNGETYNFRELRLALEAKGHTFRSGSDTEVLLHLYAEEGAGMLEWLNGMFAVAIWDALERTLFLARDRMGIKPLCYAEQDGTLYFASEEKALFAAGVRAEFDPSAWDELLLFRYTAGDRTPFKGVRRLPPGHWMLWKDGRTRVQRWWSLAHRAQLLRQAAPGDPVDWFRQTFDDAVDAHRVSDVPIGVLLSGGLDSSAIATSLGAQGVSGVASFTVRFREPEFDEGPIAAAVARAGGLDPHELVLEDRDLFDLVHESSWFNDVPLVHANEPHLLAIARYAKPLVTVLLSGEGADETLGGYVRYRPLRHLTAIERLGRGASAFMRLAPRGVAGSLAFRLGKMERLLQVGGPEEIVLHDACDVLPADLRPLGYEPTDSFPYRRGVLAEAAALYPGEPVRQAMYLDQHTFVVSVLDRNDRTTMGASIECRVPFLDLRLVEGLAAMPSERLLRGWKGKSLLRSAIGNRLPAAVLAHRKWGFGAPWVRHFQTDPRFRELIAALPDTAPISDGPFDRQKVRREAERYLAGDTSRHAIIRQLVFISIWHRECVEGAAGSTLRARRVSA